MAICSFFGHGSCGDYDKKFQQKLAVLIEDLIENCGVDTFYCGYRGNFDSICGSIVGKLKSRYPNIKLFEILSFHPPKKENYFLPCEADGSVYLLERYVPPRAAVPETNRKMADASDYIICGVKYTVGGANAAIEYAERKGKRIVYLFEDRENKRGF